MACCCVVHHHEVHRRDLTITRSCAAPRDGSPPRTRAPGSIARVTYEFRDPTGLAIRQTTARATRHIAGDPPVGRPLADPRTEPPRTEPLRTEPLRTEPLRTEPLRTEPPRTEPSRSARPVEPRGTAVPITGVARPTTGTAPEPPDDLDFTPTTDPVTGMTVPAFFLAWFQTTTPDQRG